MFLKIFLCSAVIVVSANNVIPAQTYPIYQQNGYANPQANQLSNTQPYIQSNTAQNQLQQLNISPSSIKQALLNRLLVSQPMQTISDPSAMGYSSILNGVQMNHAPANLVSNYAVVPRDYLKNNTIYSNIDTNTNASTSKPRRRRRKRPKSRKQNVGEIVESVSSKQEKTNNNIEYPMLSNVSAMKYTQKQISQATEKDTANTEIENKDKRNKRRRKKQKDQTTTEAPIKEESKTDSTKTSKRRKKQKKNEDSELENKPETKSKEIQYVDLDITNDGMDNENRLTRNSKLESNDIQKSVSNKQKEAASNVKSNMNQFNNLMMGNWFPNFESIYQSLANQPIVNEVKPKRRRKPRRSRKLKRKNSHNRNITENAVVNPSTLKIDTTTEKIALVNERQTNLNSNPTKEGATSIDPDDLSSNEIFRDGYNINEFEDKYATGYYGGYIDDYYPLFTDSAAYNANNKEIILKNLNDDKYYYATDIGKESTEKHHDTNRRIKGQTFIDYDRNRHTYDEIERESIRNAYRKEFDSKFEEKLQFRSPPHLESPDFRTRQIEKNELNPEVYYIYGNSNNKCLEDKSSSYSNSKPTYNAGAKRNEIQTQPNDVEMVYAKTKVVSYSPVYTPAEDSSSSGSTHYPWTDDSFKSDSFQNGDTTYVVAKSLDHLVPYWQNNMRSFQ